MTPAVKWGNLQICRPLGGTTEADAMCQKVCDARESSEFSISCGSHNPGPGQETKSATDVETSNSVTEDRRQIWPNKQA